MKRIFTAVLMTTALAITGCGEFGEKAAYTPIERKEVSGLPTVLARAEAVEGFVEAPGTVRAASTSVVSSKVMGAVTTLKASEGSFVKKGEVLLTIDDSDISAKIRAAEAGVAEAEAGQKAAEAGRALSEVTYSRYKKLLEEKAVSRQEFDTVETQAKAAALDFERMENSVKRAKAGLSEARAYGSYTRVTSPVTGIVSEKRTDIGSMASPGMPLLIIEGTSSFTLDVSADERLATSLRPGSKVEVIIDNADGLREGVVKESVRAVNTASRTSLIKIAVKGKGLLPGLFGRARIPAGKREALLVPATAVVERGALTGVYTVDAKGLITYRLIRKGPAYGTDVEVLSGLEKGERVVSIGADASDGAILK
ncbi:MAG: efflux RND transporter periplasmic adaptor subunit [Deltaproteobacteria bacterium]|nr:efflux RND transporter periplasmic adaptor subunit [Deltaproteobacteria bacterium]